MLNLHNLLSFWLCIHGKDVVAILKQAGLHFNMCQNDDITKMLTTFWSIRFIKNTTASLKENTCSSFWKCFPNLHFFLLFCQIKPNNKIFFSLHIFRVYKFLKLEIQLTWFSTVTSASWRSPDCCSLNSI